MKRPTNGIVMCISFSVLGCEILITIFYIVFLGKCLFSAACFGHHPVKQIIDSLVVLFKKKKCFVFIELYFYTLFTTINDSIFDVSCYCFSL